MRDSGQGDEGIRELYSNKTAKWISQVSELFYDTVYPRVCPVCGCPSDRPARCLCWDCFNRIELLKSGLCSLCGNPLTGNPQCGFLCQACRERKPFFDRARSAAHFNGVMREIILSFKYQNALWLKRDIADTMYGVLQIWEDLHAVDVVVPVPLFRTRLRERSYNQSLVLAEILAERMDRRMDSRSLKRIRGTVTQTKFNAAQRRKNIRGVFKVVRPEWVRKRTVLLVDDVMTTGATLSECARELKKAGSRQVFAVSAARR
ncbi:MAG: ComF family protein [Kiritimatiellia bacterium]